MSSENIRVELLEIAVKAHCQNCHEAKSGTEAMLQRNAVIHSVFPDLTASYATSNPGVSEMRRACAKCWNNGRSGDLTKGK